MINLINPLVKNIIKTLEKNNFSAYLVGGAVRDILLNRKTNDYDIATNALPQDLIELFGAPLKQISYGSFNIMKKGINIDITTYRIEHSYNKRHPTISYTNDIKLDAKRRDFTINAIYMNKNGQKKDFYNGLKHLKEKKIVSIGNPNLKLVEDPIRILRAIRFSALLDFNIDEELSKAIISKKEELLKLSKNIIKKELDSIFLANGFSLLHYYEIDKLFQLDFTNLVYVSDLAGLWSQIKTNNEFPLEKEIKNNIKIINNIINCDTITLDAIYNYGLYICYICADIMHINRKKIDSMYRKMPIKTPKDLKVNGKIVETITKCEKQEIKIILKEIEQLILTGKLKNNCKQIIKYLERRSKNAHD